MHTCGLPQAAQCTLSCDAELPHHLWHNIFAADALPVTIQGRMSGRDFARSLVSGVQSSMIDTYLNRIAALPDVLATAQVLSAHDQPVSCCCLSISPLYLHACCLDVSAVILSSSGQSFVPPGMWQP